jgi:hypothetical protein
MDEDLYNVLIGAAPTNAAQQRSIANALRRRRSSGELAALSGDQVLQPFGANLMRSADEYAQQIQGTRQKDIDNAQTERYQSGQLSHMGNVLKETMRAQDMDDATTRRGQDLGLLQAMLRAESAGQNRASPRLRQGDIKALQDNANALRTIRGTMKFQKEGGKLGAVEVAGMPVPLLRQTLNKAAEMGYGSEGDKQSALAWQNYRRFYDLAERNNLFGATLTPNEQKSWRDANPNMAQTDAQIAAGLSIMEKIYSHGGDTYAAGLTEEGYDPEAINSYRSVGQVDIPKDIDAPAGEMPTQDQLGTGAKPGVKRIKVDAEGNIIGN